MKIFARKFAASVLAAPLFADARQSNQELGTVEPKELTDAEIGIVAGGPEGEVGGGVAPT